MFCVSQQHVENSAAWHEGTPNHSLMDATLTQVVFHDVVLSRSTLILALKENRNTLLLLVLTIHWHVCGVTRRA